MEITDSKEYPLPRPVVCNIHPWMKAHLLSLDHPYMAVSGEDGTFEIKNLPAGTNEFQFWHELPGYLKNLSSKAGRPIRRVGPSSRSRPVKTLDLGDIKFRPAVLK